MGNKSMKKDFFPQPQRKLHEWDNEFDFDFSVQTQSISTLEEFDRIILQPHREGRRVFYRGERCNSRTRPLLPTLFRSRADLLSPERFVTLADSEFLCKYYRNMGDYYRLYTDIIGAVEPDNLYPFLAFSQHYLGISPLIDFSKSPYPALSFALKDRTEYSEDILLYTLEIKEECDYTDSVETANRWLRDYSVLVFRDSARSKLNFELENPFNALTEYRKIYERFAGSSFMQLNTPTAKLIDVPTNDLMLYQQGVFLLLDDFSLMGKSYLTKQIRDEFNIKKWLVNREICPTLYRMLTEQYPYYAFSYITDLNKIASAMKN